MNRTIVGTVVSGNHLGRTFGFPTANVVPDEGAQADLPEGVFAAHTTIDGRKYPSMVNIGRSPSVIADGGVRIEVHIIDYSGDLYGSRIEVEIVARIRSEQKFATREELVEQISRDRLRAVELLK